MNNSSTRRTLLGRAGGFLGAVGLAGNSKAAPREPETGDYYDKLGVRKIINAAGTYTVLTASTMPAEVQAAVAKAAMHPVRLLDLQTKAGEYLAGRLRCEAAMVTAGASSALTLGTAACLGVINDSPMQAVPVKTSELKRNEVLIQKAHRYSYDHAIENCGARFVEVESLDDYKNAFSAHTVMAHFFNAAEGGKISREDWVRVAREHHVPTFNDAAADVPPISNLWNYTVLGFDLVTFSGGLSGNISYGWLFIDTLWVAEEARSQGQGRGLMLAAEEEAESRGCHRAWLDTFSFQARAFYEKLGYAVFGELEDYPPGHRRFFMRKALLANRETK